MWAILHAFAHNNLDGMTLILAPKYGQTLLRSWALENIDLRSPCGRMTPEHFGLHTSE